LNFVGTLDSAEFTYKLTWLLPISKFVHSGQNRLEKGILAGKKFTLQGRLFDSDSATQNPLVTPENENFIYLIF
jgi:hypothetical protein